MENDKGEGSLPATCTLGSTRDAAVSLLFCPMRLGLPCLTLVDLTLYLDVGVDFTGYFLTYECAAWQHGRHPRGHRPPSPPCHFVRTSTLAGLSSSSPIGAPSPTSPTIVSPHAIRSDQAMCVIHPAPVTSVLVECAPSSSTEGCHCVTSSGSSVPTHSLHPAF